MFSMVSFLCSVRQGDVWRVLMSDLCDGAGPSRRQRHFTRSDHLPHRAPSLSFFYSEETREADLSNIILMNRRFQGDEGFSDALDETSDGVFSSSGGKSRL